MCVAGGDPTIERNTLFDNTGAGIYCRPSASQACLALIKDNILTGNGHGGIVCVGNDSLPACAPTIDGNTFDGNSASFGAAILLDGVRRSQSGENYTWLEIKNNLFLHNHASGPVNIWDDDLGGGAIYATDSEARIVNNTFVENLVGDGTLTGSGWTNVTAKSYGGAVHVTKPGTSTRRVTLINNIFYGNLAYAGVSAAATEKGIADISYCDAYPRDDQLSGRTNYVWNGLGVCNFPYPLTVTDLDPLFFDAAAAQYWLRSSSPLRGQGTDLGDENTADITGKDRPGTDNQFDIGAYESDPGNYSTGN